MDDINNNLIEEFDRQLKHARKVLKRSLSEIERLYGGQPRGDFLSNPTVRAIKRELWREREGDYYAEVTKGGGIGINCGGSVFVKPLKAWHSLAQQPAGAAEPWTVEWALSWIPSSATPVQRKILATGLRDVINAAIKEAYEKGREDERNSTNQR